MSGPRIAIYAGIIGLAAAVLSQVVRTEPDVHGLKQARAGKMGTHLAVSDSRKIRLELPIKLVDPIWTIDQLQRTDQARSGLDQPISEVRLLESDYFVADWRNGRVQYRVKGMNPWGASVGGQVSTSTAKLTLTWSFDD
jgi:hypothetical protein